MVTKVRTLNFLPDIFRTDYNNQFLRGVLDPIVQDKNLEKIEGFIGSKFGPGVDATNAYVPEPTKARVDYQLEPGVIFLKTNTSNPKDFISYPEIIDAIRLENGVADDHNLLFSNEYYTWDSFINLDALVNFGQYYWLKDGPDSVTVTGIITNNRVTTTTYIDVAADIIGKTTYTSPNGVVFTNGLKVLFDTSALPSTYAGKEYYVQGVGSSIALMSVSDQIAPERFTQLEYLPWSLKNYDTGKWDARLYVPETKDYITIQRNSNDRNAWSRSNQWFHIDVIRATAEYNNDPDFLNVANKTNRAQRPIIEFYGDLKLFNSGTSYVPFVDYLDTRCADAFSFVAGQKYYYPDVKTYSTATASITSYTPAPPGTSTSVATITVPTADITGTIEVDNFVGADGQTALPTNAQVTSVTVSGTNTVIGIKWVTGETITLPFNNFAIVVTPLPVSGFSLFDGSRIIFSADANPNIRNKIYVAHYDSVLDVYTLTLASDGDIAVGAQTIITRGYNAASYDYWYDGSTWIKSQQKVSVNQEPLYDIFTNSGISFSDTSLYPSSSFAGCRLFNYARGTGSNDSVLGFPLSYTGSVTNIGEITFEVSLNSDTFNYITNNVTQTVNVNTGFVHQYTDNTNYVRKIGWQTAVAPSVQYQLFQSDYTYGLSAESVTCDIPADYVSSWPVVQLYFNNVQQSSTTFSYVVADGKTTVTFTSPGANSVIQVLILSYTASTTGHYVIPINLSKNPFNEDITSLTTSDLRYYFQSIFYNSNIVTGTPLGDNNYRDLGNLSKYGTTIVKHSSSVVTPASLMRDGNYSLFNALQYNAREYVTYKNLLMYTVENLVFNQIYSSQYMLDVAIKTITDAKDKSGSFFYSDMLPSGTTYAVNNYTFNNSTTTSTFTLSRLYDFSKANYWGVLIYLNRSVNGVTTQTLLVKDRDYTISSITPSVVVTYPIVTGDVITVREYNITYGSYVPNTPTKLGMYPATIPHVYTDTHLLTPTTFIVGHDGSYTKLYGSLDSSGNLVDFRDRVLFEFETRIYNNLKLEGFTKLDIYDYLPGFFRSTPYTYDEFLTIYTPQFLNWIGSNRVDYKTQYYRSDNQFTWNYRTSNDKLVDKQIQIGYWRQLYEYMYDTSRPDTAPWELLHYVEKPSWWDSYYGAAPYTSENTLLWTDLSLGFDYNGGASRTITTAVRPGLLNALPVDSEGNIVSPFVSVVGDYANYSFNADWQVGDGSPTEYSYRRSSTWPFDLCRIIALMQPAKFYNLYIDADNYRYSTEFGQFLVNNRSSLILRNLDVYGDGTAKTSYLNWIVDYQRQYGVSATAKLKTLFSNLDVRLIYRAAAFSDKDLLKFYVEKTSPASTRSTLLIPDESYHVVLHDNTPFDRINYSSVIIQITERGYKVYGNSQTVTYFKTQTPMINGNHTTLTIGNLTAQLPNDYYDSITYVAYGTEFTDHYALAQFLANYGKYLENVGCQFAAIENGIAVTWHQMVAETLYWAQSGWNPGSTININPAAQQLVIDRPYSIVQPLTIRNQNFVLNQNLYNIQNSDLAIIRDDNYFSIAPLNKGDAIAYGQFNMSNLEHGIVFDNVTAFNDTIYKLVTGVRHHRVILRGYLTADWIGTLDANGFILNMDNIEEWNNYTTYTPGSIVTYRNRYYSAPVLIQPSAKFDDTIWKICNYNQIQKGLLPNSATRSTESAYYYDSNNANLENDADLLGFSLIGYRPRDYLSDADLTDISQVNVYKNMIKQKGTTTAANFFKKAELLQGPIDYDIYEIWSIKTYDFGGVLNSNYIELRLDQSLLTGNPTLLGLISNAYIDVQQSYVLSELHSYGRLPTSASVLPTIPVNTPNQQFMDAGYVHFDDVKTYAYTYYDLPGATKSIYQVYVNEYIWLASYISEWHVYSPVSLGFNDIIGCNDGCLLTGVINNKNGTATFQFSNKHTLNQYQMFGVIQFNNFVDGYYIAYAIIDEYTVVVQVDIQGSINTLAGAGIVVKYTDHRVSTPGNVKDMPLTVTEFVRNRAWVDTSSTGNWAVYQKSLNYKYNVELNSSKKLYGAYWDILAWDEPLWDELTSNNWGRVAVYNKKLGLIVADPLNGILYQYENDALTDQWKQSIIKQDVAGYGTGMIHNENLLFVANEDNGTVDVYYAQYDTILTNPIYIQTISVANNSVMAVSGDSRYLYIGDSANNQVNVFTGTTTLSGKIDFTQTAAFTATIVGTTLTVTAIASGTLGVGQMVLGYPMVLGTYITAFGTGTGGVGTYTISVGQFVPSSDLTAGVSILTVTSVGNGGLINTNQVLAGFGVMAGTKILSANSQLTFTIQTITSTGSQFTVTTAPVPYSWIPGQQVTIAGATAAGYDGTWTISSGTQTTFTVTSTVNLGASNGGVALGVGTNGSVGMYTTNNPYTIPVTDLMAINYTYDSTLTDAASVAGDGYGSSIATDYYSNIVVVGAPGVNSGTINNWGNSYFYTRNSQRYEYDGTSAKIFDLTWAPTARIVVTVNNILLGTNNYTINTVARTLTITGILGAGDIVSVNDTVYSKTQVSTSVIAAQRSVYYGLSAASNKYGTEILVGAPFEINTNDSEGAVYRYTQQAVKFGTISGVCLPRGVTRTVLINGYRVDLPPCSAAAAATTVVDAIVAAKINNVTATAVGTTLTIKLANSSVNDGIFKLSIVVPDAALSMTVLNELGFTLFPSTQTLLNPHSSRVGQYGFKIAFNEVGSVVISAPTDSRVLFTTFDFTDDESYDLDTIFDSNATQFRDGEAYVGAVYMYDYLSNYSEGMTNLGAFTYAQSITNLNRTISNNAKLGYSIDFSDNIVVASSLNFIGVPYADATNTVYTGQVILYKNDTEYTTDWHIVRNPAPIVDITRVKNTHLYNVTDNTTLTTLDYFDPLQGMLLGAVRSNLDYIMPSDPAQYNSPLYAVNSAAATDNGFLTTTQNQLVWGHDKVGMLWYDTSRTKFVNYHQDDIQYSSQYWGRVFPGSDVAIYTWVNSSNVPAQYTGPGTPYDIQKYVIEYESTASGQLVPTYYYWVRNTNRVDTKRDKTLSDTVLQAYILAPQSSGISYFAPLMPYAYALYNCAQYINNTDTILHIGYASGTGGDPQHTDVKLIRADYKDDFITGVPASMSGSPSELYKKWLNSMCGVDENGSVVPDIYLPTKVKNGILNSPLQGMVANRFLALKNYLQYVNSVLIQFPVRENKNPTFLFETDTYYDTTQYWEYVNFWETGYNDETIPSVQVQFYNNLEVLSVASGTVAKVLTNGLGLAEYWTYNGATWRRIGIEKGTIQFLAPLWDYTINQVGWDGNSFDTTDWDTYPSTETTYTLRAINEQLLIDDLLLYRNKAMIVFFEYVCTELDINQAYLPWLNKTSFIDVGHYVRTLSTFNTYRSDKQDFLAGYIREVKPYHVTVKEFIYKYSGLEVNGLRYTDFDFPAKYFPSTNSYISPQLAYINPNGPNQFKGNDSIWTEDRHIDWYQNFGLSLLGLKDYTISTLSKKFLTSDSEMIVRNPGAFPSNGVVTIKSATQYVDGWDANSWDMTNWSIGIETTIPEEKIYYGSIDRYTGKITNLIRGYDNTDIIDHSVDSLVVMDLPGALLMDTGRYYATTPNITVTYDTTRFPAPRQEIVITPVMSNGQVIALTIDNPGSGYAVDPIITVDPAYSLFPTAIDTTLNTLTFPSWSFKTGDKIRYKVGDQASRIPGLIDGGYYYAGVLSTLNGITTLALYKTIDDAYLDQHRIALDPDLIAPPNLSGTEHWFSYGAIIQPVVSSRPTREITTIFGWDRVTYKPTRAWTSSTYYAPAYSPDSSAAPRPVMKVLSILGSNVASLTLDYSFNVNLLEPAQLNRMRVKYLTTTGYLGAPSLIKTGYLKLTSDITVELYEDPGFTIGVPTNTLAITSVSTAASVSAPTVSMQATITGDTITAGSVGTTLTVTASTTNGITVGAEITGTGVVPGTTIVAIIAGAGGVGTYKIEPAQTFASTIVYVGGRTLNVLGVTVGTLAVGDIISGPGITPNTKITALGTGTGTLGTYTVDTVQLVPTSVSLTTVSKTLTLASTAGFNVGDPVFFSGIYTIPELIAFNTYYIASITGTSITLSGTNTYWSTAGTATITRGTQYLFSELPLNYPADRVLINSTLYECRVANNDAVFDPNKWKIVKQTFADRVDSYYSPTVNMLGKDVTQVMAGVTYPNASYSGAPFNWDVNGNQSSWDMANFDSTKWDQDPNALDQYGTYYTDTTIIDRGWPTDTVQDKIIGSSFNSGYAPEELIAGQFKELLNMYVTSSDAVLKFLLTVDVAGRSAVFNINPSTQTVVTTTLTRTNDDTDSLFVGNVNILTYSVAYPINTVDGTVIVPNVKNVLTVALPITNWIMLDAVTLKIGAPYPVPAVATVIFGNVVLINGEYIGFQKYNPLTNTITGLTRGLFNSSINETIAAGSTVQAILNTNMLPPEYMNKWWYGALGSDPALANNSLAGDAVNPAALFLQTP